MTQQVEDNDPAVPFQNAVGRLDRSLGLDCVMQRLTQQDKIDTALCNRRIFQITQPILEIFETMFLRQLRTELDHLWRVVDRDNFTRALRQQLGECSFARAKIDNRQPWNERDQCVRERFPRSSRDVTATELPCQFIEIFARFVLTLAQREFQRRPVATGFGNFTRECLDYLLAAAARAIASCGFSRAVVNILARPAACHYPGALQLCEMTGDPRLD